MSKDLTRALPSISSPSVSEKREELNNFFLTVFEKFVEKNQLPYSKNQMDLRLQAIRNLEDQSVIGEIATMCMAIYGAENPTESEMNNFLLRIEKEIKSQIPDMEKLSAKYNKIKSLAKDDHSDFNSFIGSIIEESKNITPSQYNYLLDQYYSNILLDEIDDLESKLRQKYEEIKDLKESHQISALTYLGLDSEQAKNIKPNQYDFLKEYLSEILLEERKEENLQEKLQKNLQEENLQKELSKKLKEKYEEIRHC